MKEEFTIKKDHHYFKGPKTQLAHIQVLLCLVFSTLGILVSPWFFVATVIAYSAFQRVIYKNLKHLKYRAYFFKNCTYKLKENYDQINKLFGVSEMFHHWNSARIGWRCVDGMNIELLAYCYVNKKRVYKKLITVSPEKNVDCSIYMDKNEYIFNVLSEDGVGAIYHIPRTNIKFSNIFMYKLYPYFGGDVAAPKFMKIHLEKR